MGLRNHVLRRARSRQPVTLLPNPVDINFTNLHKMAAVIENLKQELC